MVEQLGDERDAEEVIDIGEEAHARHAGRQRDLAACEQRLWNRVMDLDCVPCTVGKVLICP